jgi:hypothetical protein
MAAPGSLGTLFYHFDTEWLILINDAVIERGPFTMDSQPPSFPGIPFALNASQGERMIRLSFMEEILMCYHVTTKLSPREAIKRAKSYKAGPATYNAVLSASRGPLIFSSLL